VSAGNNETYFFPEAYNPKMCFSTFDCSLDFAKGLEEWSLVTRHFMQTWRLLLCQPLLLKQCLLMKG